MFLARGCCWGRCSREPAACGHLCPWEGLEGETGQVNSPHLPCLRSAPQTIPFPQKSPLTTPLAWQCGQEASNMGPKALLGAQIWDLKPCRCSCAAVEEFPSSPCCCEAETLKCHLLRLAERIGGTQSGVLVVVSFGEMEGKSLFQEAGLTRDVQGRGRNVLPSIAPRCSGRRGRDRGVTHWRWHIAKQRGGDGTGGERLGL